LPNVTCWFKLCIYRYYIYWSNFKLYIVFTNFSWIIAHLYI